MYIKELFETLSYVPDDIVWEGDEATFTIYDREYVVTVKPVGETELGSLAKFFTTIPKIGNVEFLAMKENGVYTQDTTFETREGVFKVFSSVAYIVSQLVKKYDYQIITCTAKRNVSPTNFQDRVNAYASIIQRAAKLNNMLSLKLLELPNDVMFVAYNPKYSTELHNIQKEFT